MDFCSRMAGVMLLEEIEKGSNNNIIVSPLSFNAILNMIAAGATGPTLEEMLRHLGSENINHLNSEFSEFMAIASTSTTTSTPDDNQNTNQAKKRKIEIQDSDGPTLSFVNGVWVTQLFKLKDSFQELLQTVYKSDARNVDFSKGKEVVKEINGWAKSASKGLITDVLKTSHITAGTRIILGNALYFKGSWVENFKRQLTKKKDFYLLNGDTVKVPFMTGCEKYSYKSFDGFQVVKIPYRAGEDKKRVFSMYIFLPNEKDGLQSLLQRVYSDSEFLTKHSKLGYGRADIFYIPKFKFTYCTEEAQKTMNKMGLTRPFDYECQDLTEMVSLPDGESLYVSAIIQKAFIEIDEEGTKAAAVSLARMSTGSACPRPKPIISFVADHPFMFMIKEEKSGLVFFTGAVLNPFLE